MKELLSAVNNHRLYKDGEFYYVTNIYGATMVNTSGSKEKVKAERERWKNEIDMNNPYMLEVENAFISSLS